MVDRVSQHDVRGDEEDLEAALSSADTTSDTGSVAPSDGPIGEVVQDGSVSEGQQQALLHSGTAEYYDIEASDYVEQLVDGADLAAIEESFTGTRIARSDEADANGERFELRSSARPERIRETAGEEVASAETSRTDATGRDAARATAQQADLSGNDAPEAASFQPASDGARRGGGDQPGEYQAEPGTPIIDPVDVPVEAAPPVQDGSGEDPAETPAEEIPTTQPREVPQTRPDVPDLTVEARDTPVDREPDAPTVDPEPAPVDLPQNEPVGVGERADLEAPVRDKPETAPKEPADPDPVSPPEEVSRGPGDEGDGASEDPGSTEPPTESDPTDGPEAPVDAGPGPDPVVDEPISPEPPTGGSVETPSETEDPADEASPPQEERSEGSDGDIPQDNPADPGSEETDGPTEEESLTPAPTDPGPGGNPTEEEEENTSPAQPTAPPAEEPPAEEPQNEAPEGLALSGDVVAENAAGAVVGTVSGSDPDGDALSWSVDDARFEMVGDTLKLRDGAALDHEAEPSVTLELTASDGRGGVTTQSVEVSVADVNEAPEGLALSGDVVAENAAGAVVGTVSGSDPDGDALSWSVDDARFEMVGDTLKLRDGTALDHEAEPSVTLELTASDGRGGVTTQSVEVSVADEVTPPPDLDVAGMFQVRQIGVADTATDLVGVDWGSEPIGEQFVDRIDLSRESEGLVDLEAGDAFATLVTGRVDAEVGGTYDFRVPSSDTALLWIDGELVALDVQPGDLGLAEVSLHLDEGTHEIVIQHLDLVGDGALRLEWREPGESDFQLTSPSPDHVVTEGEDLGLSLGVETHGNTLEAVRLEDVPADWIVEDGTRTVSSNGGDLDLTGWDLSQISVSPALGDVGSTTLTVAARTVSPSGEPGESTMQIDIEVESQDGFSIEDVDLTDALATVGVDLDAPAVLDPVIPDADDAADDLGEDLGGIVDDPVPSLPLGL
ncbi:hypothetical protein [Jannaschia aquimarina]|uniref:PA14 domain protein n=1 Tax=Jannaschia aquimarina TaxID=935700 RepID=A0A0D1EHW9_9RHOB|nr:hypothetical protein [Jannaschia aquimarina]KIT17239.1 PA14 domain protein [Jannaschia aquimarina]SNT18947.1 PA14 domain-containing protein [Jannaschia aquimarina]